MIVRPVPFVQGRRKQVVSPPAQLLYDRKSENPCLPLFRRGVLPDRQEGVESNMQLSILIDDVEAFPDELQLGPDLRYQFIVLVDVRPLDLAAAALPHLALDAGLADRASRVVVDLHLRFPPASSSRPLAESL